MTHSPYLPYLDAVHEALTEAGYTPASLTASPATTGPDEEFVALLSWPDMQLRWSSLDGWRHEAGHCGGELFVERLAAPDAITTCVALLGDGHPPLSSRVRWHRAAEVERHAGGGVW
ncbi:hypothetical protein OG896_24990 [Streptomyces sp. NBC_00669]|uniref:hypothetical protein n=1 Tax=Streptomyces sp. NBC_00669 TaxID=2976011 RepID=UPI002E315994|nr:hypothetical protein [Streptomyces sp. NBC_00669]